jgi:hypothetical protein
LMWWWLKKLILFSSLFSFLSFYLCWWNKPSIMFFVSQQKLCFLISNEMGFVWCLCVMCHFSTQLLTFISLVKLRV